MALTGLLIATLGIAGFAGEKPKEGAPEAKPPAAAAVPKSDSFAELCSHLDITKRTVLHANEYWKQMMGTEVAWAGKVVSATGGKKGMAEINVVNKEVPAPVRGYNIILMTREVEKAAALEKGDRIRFKGTLDKYRPERDRVTITVTLRDAVLLGEDDSPASE
jgi:hypothetical protein